MGQGCAGVVAGLSQRLSGDVFGFEDWVELEISSDCKFGCIGFACL